MSDIIRNRYDFVLFFDVENGNPNGDPDSGNMPRIDPETGHGLVTDVCIKRKVRNFVDMVKNSQSCYRIYVQDGAILNFRNLEAYTALKISVPKKNDEDKSAVSLEDKMALTRWMCENFYDIRTFGAVMSTEVNCGQVRGPVQLTFARSIDPIVPMEVSITRMAATKENEKNENRTMGRKYIVPYGLYRMEGFINAPLAENTGFTDADLELFTEALEKMFENDHSASRGKMNTRKLVMFRHDSKWGNAPAQTLFDLVHCERKDMNKPPRSFSDYEITVDEKAVPKGVELV